MDTADVPDSVSPKSVPTAFGVVLPHSESQTNSPSFDHPSSRKRSFAETSPPTEEPDLFYESDFEFTEEEESEMPPRDKLCAELLANQPPPTGEPVVYRPMPLDDLLAYCEQVQTTRGFDIKTVEGVDYSNAIHPACTSEKSLDEIIRCAKAAVKHENKRRRKYNRKKSKKLNELRLIGIVKAMCQLCFPMKYYLTLKVEEIIDGKEALENTYQAKICLWEPPGKTSFASFRVEGHRERFEGSDFSDSESEPKEREQDDDSDSDFDHDDDIPVKTICKELLENYKNDDEDEDTEEDEDEDTEENEDEDTEEDEDEDTEENEDEDMEVEEDETEYYCKEDEIEKLPCQSLKKEEREDYNKQVECTDGFDVKLISHNCGHGLIKPVRTHVYVLEKLVRIAKTAVKSENKRREKDNEKRLKLTGIVKAMYKISCPTTYYYITLKAEEMDGEDKSSEADVEKVTKIYEALVRSYPRPTKPELLSFKAQGAGIVEAFNWYCVLNLFVIHS